jgi:hypothetical protein
MRIRNKIDDTINKSHCYMTILQDEDSLLEIIQDVYESKLKSYNIILDL